jgi:hypothetical protein
VRDNKCLLCVLAASCLRVIRVDHISLAILFATDERSAFESRSQTVVILHIDFSSLEPERLWLCFLAVMNLIQKEKSVVFVRIIFISFHDLEEGSLRGRISFTHPAFALYHFCKRDWLCPHFKLVTYKSILYANNLYYGVENQPC